MDSSKPSKQRKHFFEMKLHEKQKAIASHLSKALRKELGIRAIGVRKGDKVKVMRGSNNRKEGKVIRVDCNRMFVLIEGITRKKSNGTEVPVRFHPSNLLITELERKDERRFRKSRAAKAKGSARGEK